MMHHIEILFIEKFIFIIIIIIIIKLLFIIIIKILFNENLFIYSFMSWQNFLLAFFTYNQMRRSFSQYFSSWCKEL